MTVVDAHVHVFAPVTPEFPRDVHELYPAELDASAELLLGEMERASVERAVLVPLSHHDDYVRSAVERHPGRFAAIGVQRPGSYDVEEYRRRRDAARLQGLRLYALGDEAVTDPRHLPSFPLLSELERSGDKLWFYGDRLQMELLELVLDALPNLTVVLNHLGFWPDGFYVDHERRPRFTGSYSREGLELVQRLARFPRVFALCSGLYAFAAGPAPYLDLRWVTSGVLEALGPGRLLLASDFPWIRSEPGYVETIGTLDAHFPELDELDRARIRGGNALDLFVFRG